MKKKPPEIIRSISPEDARHIEGTAIIFLFVLAVVVLIVIAVCTRATVAH